MAKMYTYKSAEQANVFEEMFACLPHALALTDDKGLILHYNPAFAKLTGGNQIPAPKPFIEDLFSTRLPHPGSMIRTFMQSKELCNEYKDRFVVVGGKRTRLRITLSRLSRGICFTVIPIEHEQEGTQRYDDLHHLYSTLSQKNNELIVINQELNRSNQELSQYAYVASHDLQEPLRKIRIFSDILAGNFQLPAKDRFIASKINKASERMGFLIRDLLSYSKLVKTDVATEEVNLNEILSAVINDFEMTIQEKKAVVEFYELPKINAVRLHMNQLFYNLLSNALKFTAHGKPPAIKISCHEISFDEVCSMIPQAVNSRTYLKIIFRDNGIGFDKKNAEKIFEVFQRLATAEKYQGSGIGLALCRRIVQNHGGMMYADSEPGKGSSFKIIIPGQKID